MLEGYGKNLRKQINKYKYISFDLFDTLIKRYVSYPTDVFAIVESAYIKKYRKNGIEDFQKIRVDAERYLRRNCKGEITLKEIYEYLGKTYSDEIIDRYRELELNIELEISYPNIEMIKLYKECLSQNKKVYIVTDMYLPKNTIEKILKRNGICGYRRLYISCELKKTKRSGELFKHILSEEGISVKDIVHIGDNYISDYVKPRIMGIRSFHIAENKSSNRKKNEFVSILDNYIYHLNKSKTFDKYTSIGVSVLGPLIFGYVMWLKYRFENSEYDKILFFSREGMLIKKAYDIVNNNKDGLYFYASRRALQVAAIWISPDYENVMNSMFLPRTFTLEWLINNWGLSWSDIICESELLGLNRNDYFSKFRIMEDKRVRELYEQLKARILDKSRKECEAFVQFLFKNNICGKIAIVDIGWNGNMQKAFERIVKTYVPSIISVSGFYLGVFTETQNNKIQKMESYISYGNELADYVKKIYAHTTLEILCMANHGSLLRYSGTDLKNELLTFAEFEYYDTNTYYVVEKIQLGALHFVKEFLKLGELLDGNNEYIEYSLKKFEHPSLEFASIIGDLKIIDNSVKSIAAPKKIWKYFMNPSTLCKDFVECSWKIGFCKRLFKVSINYRKIINWFEKCVVSYIKK